jgi:hypothetical protein
MDHRCESCASEYHYTLERCPHCAHPGNYSNVVIASDPAERLLVDRRYENALSGAERRGCGSKLEEFTNWLKDSRAVIARPYSDIDRLAAGDNSVQATFYDLIDAGMRLPDGSLWEQLRRPADEVLFPNYREKIRFGALSGDGIGVINYGHFWIMMRTSFIEHRTTLFDQNSVAFVSQRRLGVAARSLRGHRATWENRSKLVVAQLGEHIASSTGLDQFPGILLKQGSTTADDRFIEVQIWGPITVRTIETVKFRWNLIKDRTPRSLLKRLAIALAKFDARLEETP